MDHSSNDQQPHTSKQNSTQESEDNVSEISNLSGLEEENEETRWRPNPNPIHWVTLQMLSGADPRMILEDILPTGLSIPDEVDQMTLWRIVASILSEPPKRKKLKEINTMEDAVGLIQSCKKIMVLTGAGISVSCGIPDFRSKDGIYAKLAKDYPDLAEPQDMFDIRFFSKNPKPFFKFASEIYPGQFTPSVSHRFIKHIEENRKLLRNYTQNIDTLEQVAGITNVVQCHGSFATASCMVCKYKVNSESIKDDVMKQQIPRCPQCSSDNEMAVMKPDIVFFGEGLPEEFHKQMELDKDQCDLLIVIGSSLKVRPVALIPTSLPANIPQILINREPLRHMTFDVELLGNCDVIVETLARRLGWCELFGDKELVEVGPECLIEKEETQTADGKTTQKEDNDENTCDGFIENLQHCHLCQGSSNECKHNESDGNDASGQAAEQGVDNDAGKEDQAIGNVTPETNVERISHDFELTPSGERYGVPQPRVSLAEKLPCDSYAFLPPNRYLFPGGELMNYQTTTDDDDDDDDDDSSSSSSNASDDIDESIKDNLQSRVRDLADEHPSQSK